MANHKGPDFTMNHSIIGRALLLGALLLGGTAHAETEDIPLPGDVQNAPLKSARKPAHHGSNSASSSHETRRRASKPGRKHRAASSHATHHGKHAGAARKPGKKAPVTAGKLHAKKPSPHKASKNKHLKKKAGKKHKKLH